MDEDNECVECGCSIPPYKEYCSICCPFDDEDLTDDDLDDIYSD